MGWFLKTFCEYIWCICYFGNHHDMQCMIAKQDSAWDLVTTPVMIYGNTDIFSEFQIIPLNRSNTPKQRERERAHQKITLREMHDVLSSYEKFSVYISYTRYY